MNNLINIRVGEINSNSPLNQGSNYNNRGSHKKHFVPAFLLSNVMSLAPKIDELRIVAHNTNPDSSL